jgi:5,10-methenyltetrahydrofolate synthetase
MNVQAMKQGIRQSIIALRDQMPAPERARFSRAIAEGICRLPAYEVAETVLGYLNFGAELAAEDWVRRALADGKRVLLPRVNRASRHLDLYQVRNLGSDVAPGLWGIREPVMERCERIDAPGAVDFALLPGVAFYDRLLARLPDRPALVAGAFGLQLVAELPQEATDRKVEWLVTETETIHCAAPDGRC